ncbi:hypothetical protein [Planctomicrobium sp. SH527]|uniref:hypothetical protein n=1 Tax=Planctomicrobium sp. SH527 TaxID=3448123 RepID=UPI003F5C2126
MQPQTRRRWFMRRRYVSTALCLCVLTLIVPLAIREISLNYQVATLVENITNPPPGQNMHGINQYLASTIVKEGGRRKLLNRFTHILNSPDRHPKRWVYELLYVEQLTSPAIRDSLLRIANDESEDPAVRTDAIFVLRSIDPVIDDFCKSVEELKPPK